MHGERRILGNVPEKLARDRRNTIGSRNTQFETGHVSGYHFSRHADSSAKDAAER
jgi:hypothetical protein